jgi:hypothetical protein
MRYVLFILIVSCVDKPSLIVSPASTNVPTTDCEKACQNMARFGCQEAQNVPGGDSCVTFCEKVKRDDRLRLSVDCVISAQSEVELHACKVRCQKGALK